MIYSLHQLVKYLDSLYGLYVWKEKKRDDWNVIDRGTMKELKVFGMLSFEIFVIIMKRLWSYSYHARVNIYNIKMHFLILAKKFLFYFW